MTTGAETEVLQLQTKERLGLPEAGKGKERSSSRGFRGSMTHKPLDFRLPASRTVRE